MELGLSKTRENKLGRLCPNADASDTEIQPTNEEDEEHNTPSVSRIAEFVADIRNEVEGKRQDSHVVLVEDLGTEENPCGTNPLPVDSPTLLVDLTDVQMTGLFFGNNGVHVTSVVEVTENVSTQELRKENGATPMVEVVGMTNGTRQEFLKGQSVVVNLSDGTLNEAEISLLFKGLSVCPTPEKVDVLFLRKDIFEYVRRIRLKEYFYSDDEVSGDFSDTPSFRKKSS